MIKASVPCNVGDLAKWAKEGRIADYFIQRRYCWTLTQKSLLIHSAIEDFIVPPFFSKREEDEEKSKPKKKFYVYKQVDGKQRANAFISFVNDEFALTGLPLVKVENEEGAEEEIDINGKKFSELPESLQLKIKGFSLTFYYYDDIDDDQAREIFYRLNNGRALTAVEKRRAKTLSFDKMMDIASHDLFKTVMTSKAIEKGTNEDYVQKSLIMLLKEQPDMSQKTVDDIMINNEITDETEENLNQVYDRILDCYNSFISDTEALSKKIAKNIVKKTHLFSLIKICSQSIKEQVHIDDFSDWIAHFYGNKEKGATISEEYNINAGAGSGTTLAIESRLRCITEDYNNFMKERANNKSITQESLTTVQEQQAEQNNQENLDDSNLIVNTDNVVNNDNEE